MAKIIIEGNHVLEGTIEISGAKNSAVALVPASILSDGEVTIDNIPDISDISALNEILKYLGAKVKLKNGTITIDSSTIENKEILKEDNKTKGNLAIPIGAGLSTAAIAGLGAKAYLDKKAGIAEEEEETDNVEGEFDISPKRSVPSPRIAEKSAKRNWNDFPAL